MNNTPCHLLRPLEPSVPTNNESHSISFPKNLNSPNSPNSLSSPKSHNNPTSPTIYRPYKNNETPKN